MDILLEGRHLQFFCLQETVTLLVCHVIIVIMVCSVVCECTQGVCFYSINYSDVAGRSRSPYPAGIHVHAHACCIT